MLEALQRALSIPELKKRIGFVLMMFLIYAIGAHIPVPGVDHAKLEAIFSNGKGGVLSLVDVFSGGALRRMSLFAMSIGPYINASIIMQMMSLAVPQLEALSKEGESGRKQIAKYTRYLTIILAFVQSYGFTMVFEQSHIGIHPLQRLVICTALTAGSLFLLWIGEQVTQHGVGNGVSLVIFAGILLSLPYQFSSIIIQVKTGTAHPFSLVLLIIAFVAMTYAVVYITQGTRRIPIQHTKRVIGMRQTQANASFLPIKVNMAGVIPIIFAISLVLLPTTIINAIPANTPFVVWLKEKSMYLNPGNIPSLTIPLRPHPIAFPFPIALVFYFLLVIVFTYFYTAIVMNVQEMADNLKKYGNYIPGIRPGKATLDYLERVVSRITLAGAVFLGLIAVSQYILPNLTGFSQNSFPIIGGTSLLIVVGVAIETMQAIEAQLIMRNYEGFIKNNEKRS
jgi:preprotein translocase subunit SecY